MPLPSSSLPALLVVDGFDGSGKTTLATALGHHLGAPVARPFTGPVAQSFAAHFDAGRFQELHRCTRDAVDGAVASLGPAPKVVFDRHWLTLLSVLPPDLWEGWLPPPPTVMTWAPPEVTFQRLTLRGETRRNTLAYHQEWCARFLDLARRFQVPVLDTSRLSRDQVLERALALLVQP